MSEMKDLDLFNPVVSQKNGRLLGYVCSDKPHEQPYASHEQRAGDEPSRPLRPGDFLRGDYHDYTVISVDLDPQNTNWRIVARLSTKDDAYTSMSAVLHNKVLNRIANRAPIE